MVLLIAYDLHKPDRDYAGMEKVIKTASSWAHLEESVWLIETSSTPETWRDRLKQEAEDATYFVVRLQHSWSSWQLDSDIVNWLKSGRAW